MFFVTLLKLYILPKKEERVIVQFFATIESIFNSITIPKENIGRFKELRKLFDIDYNNLQKEVGYDCSKSDTEKSKINFLIKLKSYICESKLTTYNRFWLKAYQYEQEIVNFYSVEQLDVELKRRVLEAELKLEKEKSRLYVEEIKTISNDATKRAILQRLINDLQWYYTNREEKYAFQKLLIFRTIVTYISITVLYISLFLFCLPNIEQISGVKQFVLVLTSGVFGGSFSSLLNLKETINKSSIEKLKSVSKLGYVLLRPIVGSGCAVAFYILLYSGLLKGDLFPDVTDTSKNSIQFKIILWGVIAGFSETFINKKLNSLTDSK